MPNEQSILLIEDNPDDEALTLRAFARNHIRNQVIVAHDGVEAIDYLFGRDGKPGCDGGELPALVLLDLKLPRVDGLEVLRRIRADAATNLLPVVILTTSLEQQDIYEGYSLGANSYIRKPVDFERFIQAVGQLGLYWLGLNEAVDSAVHYPA